MWHVSIGQGGKPVSQWLSWHVGIAKALAVEMMYDVGGDFFVWDVKTVAVHLRRELSAEELASVDQKWLALKAVDPG